MTRFRPPRPIVATDRLDEFRSGDDALDDWLRRRAIPNEGAGASRTYVTTHPQGSVAGYYCLSTAALPRSHGTGRARRNMPDPIPAFLLGRLAVDQRHQGCGLGANLLRDAIRRCLTASEIIGSRVLLVHAASPEAKTFYEHLDFEPSPTDPLHLLLVLEDAIRNGF